MRADLEALAAECVELRRALHDSQARRQVRPCALGQDEAEQPGRHAWRQAERHGGSSSSSGSNQHSVARCPWACCADPAYEPYPVRPPWLPQEAEGLVGELSGVVQQQKLRLRSLAQEKAEACARLQALNPQELERLRGELLALRERAGELGAVRDQLAAERRLAESLQQRLAGVQQQLLEARQGAAARWVRAGLGL